MVTADVQELMRNTNPRRVNIAFGSRAWHVSRHGLQLRLRLLLLRLRLPVNEANRTYGSDILW